MPVEDYNLHISMLHIHSSFISFIGLIFDHYLGLVMLNIIKALLVLCFFNDNAIMQF